MFELHKTHGLHVHVLANLFIKVETVRALAPTGWGRINVKRLLPHKIGYLAKGLDRKRAPCLKGWRLWDHFGNWQATRAKDVKTTSLFSTIYQACKRWQGWAGRAGFFDRMKFVRRVWLRTIEEGWQAALGPNGKPYSDCSSAELGLEP